MVLFNDITKLAVTSFTYRVKRQYPQYMPDMK